LFVQGFRHEKNLSAKSIEEGANARIPRPHVNTKRPQSPPGKTQQGPRPVDTLNRTAFTGRDAGAFTKASRLKISADFRLVFDSATRSTDEFFTVFARATGTRPARLGLAISKRCAVRAVERNRLKRIVRDSFRRSQLELKGSDCVVLCRRQAIGATNRTLFNSLAGHWQRVRDQLCVGS